MKEILMQNNKALVLLVLAVLPLQSFATDFKTRLDGHISTLGGGLELSAPLTEKFDARVGFNTFTISADQASSGLNYKGDLKLSSVSVLADWRPWSGVTHLTAGIIFNSNKLAMKATAAAGTYNINGTDYVASAGDTMTTSVEFNKVSPYLGFGWSGQPKNKGFSLSSDIGILFQGSPKATVVATGVWASQPGLTADSQNQLNTDLKGFKMYPVVSFGIGYAF
jgi:hypothetical protein